MNHFTDQTCCFCNSTLVKRRGSPHCTGDNLSTMRQIFDDIISLEESSPSEFAYRVDNLVGNEDNYDLFVDYWRAKKENPNAHLQCLHEQTYFRDTNGEPGKLPMPEPYIPFPDLVEVYIAEIMLGRELTPNEKDGSRWIPKIDQDTGLDYFAPLTWTKWPHGYISLKDMYIKTDYTEGPLPVIFEIDVIRCKYAGRSGEVRDE